MKINQPKHRKIGAYLLVDLARLPAWPQSFFRAKGASDPYWGVDSDDESWVTMGEDDTYFECASADNASIARSLSPRVGAYAVWGRGPAGLSELLHSCPDPDAVLVENTRDEIRKLADVLDETTRPGWLAQFLER